MSQTVEEAILKNMRGDFQDLGDAYMFKEAFIGRQRIHTMPELLFTDGANWQKKPESPN